MLDGLGYPLYIPDFEYPRALCTHALCEIHQGRGYLLPPLDVQQFRDHDKIVSNFHGFMRAIS